MTRKQTAMGMSVCAALFLALFATGLGHSQESTRQEAPPPKKDDAGESVSNGIAAQPEGTGHSGETLMDRREERLDQRAERLDRREDQLNQRSISLDKREEMLTKQEKDLENRELALVQKEGEMKAKELTLNERERDPGSLRARPADRKPRVVYYGGF